MFKKNFLHELSPINISPIHDSEKSDLKNNNTIRMNNEKDTDDTNSEKSIPTTPQEVGTSVYRRTRSSTRRSRDTKRNFTGPKTRTQTKKSAEQKGKGIRSTISWIVY